MLMTSILLLPIAQSFTLKYSLDKDILNQVGTIIQSQNLLIGSSFQLRYYHLNSGQLIKSLGGGPREKIAISKSLKTMILSENILSGTITNTGFVYRWNGSQYVQLQKIVRNTIQFPSISGNGLQLTFSSDTLQYFSRQNEDNMFTSLNNKSLSDVFQFYEYVKVSYDGNVIVATSFVERLNIFLIINRDLNTVQNITETGLGQISQMEINEDGTVVFIAHLQGLTRYDISSGMFTTISTGDHPYVMLLGSQIIACQKNKVQWYSFDTLTLIDERSIDYECLKLHSSQNYLVVGSKARNLYVYCLQYFDGTNCVSSCPNLVADQKCVDECPLFINVSQCVSTCPHFAEGSVCVASCKKYTDGIQCAQTCPNFINGTVCVPECQKFSDGIMCVQQCTNFVEGTVCKDTCPHFSDGSQCVQSCQKFVDGTKCLPVCPKYSNDNTCVQNCPNFIDETVCVAQCPKVSIGNICVSECPKNTYLSKTNCVNCPAGCQKCDSTGCQDQFENQNAEKENTQQNSGLSRTKKIIVGSLVGVFGLACVVGVVAFCLCRNRNQFRYTETQNTKGNLETEQQASQLNIKAEGEPS